jgi:hypothetical protein
MSPHGCQIKKKKFKLKLFLENWDDWADRIADEYVTKRKTYASHWGHEKNAPKKTSTGGIGTGKRNKLGRRNKKENERIEYLDHQKRRVENYIRAQVNFFSNFF